jgi:hypothetical protein
MATTTHLDLPLISTVESAPERIINAAMDRIDQAQNALNTIALADSNASLTLAQVQPFQFLKFTGTLTAVRTLTLPGGAGVNGHLWFIRNQCTHRLILGHSSGQTISLARTQSGFGWWQIVSDGTDLYHLSGYRGSTGNTSFSASVLEFDFQELRNVTGSTRTLSFTNWYLGARTRIIVPSGITITLPGSVTMIAGANPVVGIAAGRICEITCIDADETTPLFTGRNIN